MNTVLVVNDTNQIVSKTNPAVARKLLAKKEAAVVSKNPFIIHLFKASSLEIPEELKMETRNIMELAKSDQPIYLQNLTGDGQISMGMRTPYNELKKLRIPNSAKPVCITNEFSADEIRNFTDLKKMINAGIVRVMNQADYDDFLKKGTHPKVNAKKIKETPLAPTVAPNDETNPEDQNAIQKAMAMSGQTASRNVRARIIGVCDRLDKKSDNSLEPIEALEQFEGLVPLHDDEYIYIMSNCNGNGIIKKWILNKQTEDIEEVDDTIDNQNPNIEIQPRPKTKGTKKK